MENISVWFKGLIAFIGAGISAAIDGIGLAVTVLISLMLIDIFTGLLVGIATKELSSSVGTVGIIRKIYVLILIGAVYALSNIVDLAEFAGDGLAIAYAIMEFLSIIENGGKLGVPLPKKLKEVISVLKGKVE